MTYHCSKICGRTLVRSAPSSSFTYAPFVKEARERRDGAFPDRRVGRDLSALVTQGRALRGLTRYGAEVAGVSSRGPRDPAVIPCNLIVSGKGRVQTTGDAATHSPLRTEWHHGLPMVADVLNRNHA